MYQLADARRTVIDAWHTELEWCAEQWSESDTWDDVRQAIYDRMAQVNADPQPTKDHLDRLFAWLNDLSDDDDRRKVVSGSDDGEQLLRAEVLSTNDQYLTELYVSLYGFADGDYYQDDEGYRAFQNGAWGDYVAYANQQSQPASVTDLAWVTDEQQRELTGIQDGWQDWLPTQLDTWWAEWRTSTPEVLSPWLDGWIPTLTPTQTTDPTVASTVPADQPEPAEKVEQDVTDLDSWVTPQQQSLLEDYEANWGDWRVWLPDELDSRWPGWTERTPEKLSEQLDTLIPLLVLPSSDDLVEQAGEIAQKIMGRLDTNPEYREALADYSPEELEDLLNEALGTEGATR